MEQKEWTILRETFDENPEKAFESLYDGLWSRLFSIALNYVRDTAVAQEIVQDVFVTLWVKREKLVRIDDIGSFALRAVRNRIYDHFDKKSVRHRYHENFVKTAVVEHNPIQDELEYRETLERIDIEIGKLPQTTQRIFRLSRFERFSNMEIASTLKLSVKSVEYHITQALKHLRTNIRHAGILLILLQS